MDHQELSKDIDKVVVNDKYWYDDDDIFKIIKSEIKASNVAHSIRDNSIYIQTLDCEKQINNNIITTSQTYNAKAVDFTARQDNIKVVLDNIINQTDQKLYVYNLFYVLNIQENHWCLIHINFNVDKNKLNNQINCQLYDSLEIKKHSFYESYIEKLRLLFNNYVASGFEVEVLFDQVCLGKQPDVYSCGPIAIETLMILLHIENRKHKKAYTLKEIIKIRKKHIKNIDDKQFGAKQLNNKGNVDLQKLVLFSNNELCIGIYHVDNFIEQLGQNDKIIFDKLCIKFLYDELKHDLIFCDNDQISMHIVQGLEKIIENKYNDLINIPEHIAKSDLKKFIHERIKLLNKGHVFSNIFSNLETCINSDELTWSENGVAYLVNIFKTKVSLVLNEHAQQNSLNEVNLKQDNLNIHNNHDLIHTSLKLEDERIYYYYNGYINSKGKPILNGIEDYYDKKLNLRTMFNGERDYNGQFYNGIANFILNKLLINNIEHFILFEGRIINGKIYGVAKYTVVQMPDNYPKKLSLAIPKFSFVYAVENQKGVCSNFVALDGDMYNQFNTPEKLYELFANFCHDPSQYTLYLYKYFELSFNLRVLRNGLSLADQMMRNVFITPNTMLTVPYGITSIANSGLRVDYPAQKLNFAKINKFLGYSRILQDSTNFKFYYNGYIQTQNGIRVKRGGEIFLNKRLNIKTYFYGERSNNGAFANGRLLGVLNFKFKIYDKCHLILINATIIDSIISGVATYTVLQIPDLNATNAAQAVPKFYFLYSFIPGMRQYFMFNLADPTVEQNYNEFDNAEFIGKIIKNSNSGDIVLYDEDFDIYFKLITLRNLKDLNMSELQGNNNEHKYECFVNTNNEFDGICSYVSNKNTTVLEHDQSVQSFKNYFYGYLDGDYCIDGVLGCVISSHTLNNRDILCYLQTIVSEGQLNGDGLCKIYVKNENDIFQNVMNIVLYFDPASVAEIQTLTSSEMNNHDELKSFGISICTAFNSGYGDKFAASIIGLNKIIPSTYSEIVENTLKKQRLAY